MTEGWSWQWKLFCVMFYHGQFIRIFMDDLRETISQKGQNKQVFVKQ